MRLQRTSVAIIAAFALTTAFTTVGCDNTTEPTPEVEVTRDLEPVDPQADVEVMPSGEVDVDLEPNVTE